VQPPACDDTRPRDGALPDGGHLDVPCTLRRTG
jgi:hypothetical protein